MPTPSQTRTICLDKLRPLSAKTYIWDGRARWKSENETNNINDLRALLRYMVFDNWNQLMHFMLVCLELIPDT